MLAFVTLAAILLGIALIGYAIIAQDLPAPTELKALASDFQTTRIFDRNGNLLNETFDPNAGRRTAVSLERISPYVVEAAVATEDANFFEHPGIDPVALVRALYYAVLEREVVAGGSTITQQLVKMVFLTPEQTLTRKIKEAILAAEITRRYTKEEILEIYLNEVYYGNLAYGIDAAAETYFGKEAADLTLAEATLLAGLPQLPAYYDPYTHPERAKERQAIVLGLMVEGGYLTKEQADAAWQEPLSYAPLEFNLNSPHFTIYVRQQLEQLYGAAGLYQAGYNVTTTLDPDLQAQAERIVAEQVAALADRSVSNGALVAMRPDSGEVVALVGSADFNNPEIDGQVNMALAPRQPGSSIKPLVYLTAFAQPDRPVGERWTPGTLIADIQQPFPDGANPPYVPTNYDGKEHGMVPVRTALANSFNIPAVAALQTVGLPAFLQTAQTLGITTLTRPDYGLALSLGAGEVPLLEMTGAFAVLANNGIRVPPVTILKITDSAGTVICEQRTEKPCQGSAVPEQVVNPIDAFLLTDMLSDNDARSLSFGPNSVLRLERPAAVKTGTTNDFRDNLTIGYTPQLVTGVWVGNSDNSPMRNISGVAGAGPIWNQFMTVAHAGQPAQSFAVPPGVRQFEICADTGTQPSSACPEKRQQWFAEDRPPLPPERDLWQRIRMQRDTNQLATNNTPPELVEERVFKVYPEQWRSWAEANGIPQPPPGALAQPNGTPPPQGQVQILINLPADGNTVGGVVPIYGSAAAPNFYSFELQYGISHDPGAFSQPFVGPYGNTVDNGLLGQWDTTGLENGPHTLRLIVRDVNGGIFEARARLFVDNQAATPTETLVAVEPPTATWTPMPVPPTETPVVVLPPTETPVIIVEPPTSTPTETPVVIVELPTDTPTETPVPLPPTETPAIIVEPPTSTPTETPVAIIEPPAEPVVEPTAVGAEGEPPPAEAITDTLILTDSVLETPAP